MAYFSSDKTKLMYIPERSRDIEFCKLVGIFPAQPVYNWGFCLPEKRSDYRQASSVWTCGFHDCSSRPGYCCANNIAYLKLHFEAETDKP